VALLCVAYVIGVGAFLGVVGLLVERSLPAEAPRRWIWCIVIGMNVLLPALYRGMHTTTVGATHVHGAGMAHTPWLLSVRFDGIFESVWLAASVILLVWFGCSALRVAHLLHVTRRKDTVDGVPVLMTDAVGPATVGIFRSRVLLPDWVLGLPAFQRQYVVRHEDEHRRAHDARLLFLASLPLILLPWNLAFWWHVRRLRLAVELDCDRRVVRALGDGQTYAALLLKVAEAGRRGPQLQPALLGAGSLERRLRALVAPSTTRRALRVALPIVALLLFAVLLMAPHPVLATGTPHAAAEPTMVSR
jgi:beta-lactamase regulating signal transducer with metallopeptidase domain